MLIALGLICLLFALAEDGHVNLIFLGIAAACFAIDRIADALESRK